MQLLKHADQRLNDKNGSFNRRSRTTRSNNWRTLRLVCEGRDLSIFALRETDRGEAAKKGVEHDGEFRKLPAECSVHFEEEHAQRAKDGREMNGKCRRKENELYLRSRETTRHGRERERQHTRLDGSTTSGTDPSPRAGLSR
jgi:hypothetical protein